MSFRRLCLPYLFAHVEIEWVSEHVVIVAQVFMTRLAFSTRQFSGQRQFVFAVIVFSLFFIYLCFETVLFEALLLHFYTMRERRVSSVTRASSSSPRCIMTLLQPPPSQTQTSWNSKTRRTHEIRTLLLRQDEIQLNNNPSCIPDIFFSSRKKEKIVGYILKKKGPPRGLHNVSVCFISNLANIWKELCTDGNNTTEARKGRTERRVWI